MLHVDRSTDGRRPVDTRPGNFRRRVEKQSRPFDKCPETIFLCFSPFIPKQTRFQKCKGTQTAINKQPKTQLSQRMHEFNIHKFKNTSNTRNWMKVNQMVIKLGNEIPQYKQHNNEICKQKQKKAKFSTKTTMKLRIKPRSPAAAPFDEPSKYGVSRL